MANHVEILWRRRVNRIDKKVESIQVHSVWRGRTLWDMNVMPGRNAISRRYRVQPTALRTKCFEDTKRIHQLQDRCDISLRRKCHCGPMFNVEDQFVEVDKCAGMENASSKSRHRCLSKKDI